MPFPVTPLSPALRPGPVFTAGTTLLPVPDPSFPR
jgi:hypothetical protein